MNKTQKPPATFDERSEMVSQSVDQHHNMLVAYAYGFCKNWDDAQDITQRVWQYVVVHFPEGQIGNPVLLRRKCKQTFIDFYRARKRKATITLEDAPEPVTFQTSQEAYTDAEEKELKRKFFDDGFPGIDLDDKHKDVLILHARYSFTYREIEEKTDIPASTVCDMVKRARKTLKQYLQNE